MSEMFCLPHHNHKHKSTHGMWHNAWKHAKNCNETGNEKLRCLYDCMCITSIYLQLHFLSNIMHIYVEMHLYINIYIYINKLCVDTTLISNRESMLINFSKKDPRTSSCPALASAMMASAEVKEASAMAGHTWQLWISCWLQRNYHPYVCSFSHVSPEATPPCKSKQSCFQQQSFKATTGGITQFIRHSACWFDAAPFWVQDFYGSLVKIQRIYAEGKGSVFSGI